MKKKIEFYTTTEGEVMIQEDGKPIVELTPSNTEFINDMFDRIRQDYPEAYSELHECYKSSEKNFTYYRFLVVRRFIRCNFSAMDTTKYDIDESDNFNFEKVQCPMRGECRQDGIVCNPKFATTLTYMERTVLEVYCRPTEVDELAAELFISQNTANVHLKNIRRKTGCHDKASLMKFFETKNI